MNVEELSMIGPAVDLQTVNSINKRRLIAFVNHFIINTASFLNKLSQSCEERFLTLENKMMKLEAAVIILESKLGSVPGLEADEAQKVQIPDEPVKTVPDIEPEAETETKVVEESQPTSVELPDELVKYTKMLQFGVPGNAVRLKMEQEGVDAQLFDLVLTHGR